VPAGCCYAAAGLMQDGIVERIKRGMAGQFPEAPEPNLVVTSLTMAVAYAYLEAAAAFATPYFERELEFTGADGKAVRVSGFGVSQGNNPAVAERLAKQLEILYADYEVDEDGYETGGVLECVLDLDRTSEAVQVIVALVDWQGTLAKTVAYLEEKMAVWSTEEGLRRMGSNDYLAVPNVHFKVEHRFAKLEGQDLVNPGCEVTWIEAALQRIEFRLDRSGAFVRSGAQVVVKASRPCEFVFDRPFLILLRQRSGGRPFFAMWVADGELLCKVGR